MFSEPQKEIYNTTKERALFMSGIGSGKTFLLAQRSLKYIIKFPNVIGLIGANTYSQLTKSTLKQCFDTWYKHYGLINGRHYVVDKIPPESFTKIHVKLKSYENTISFNNGAVVYTPSLDNYKVIDGTEIGWACLDETKDTKEGAVKEVINGRLRQSGMYIDSKGNLTDKVTEQSHNPLAIFTSPAKVLWLNEWFGMPDYYEDIIKHIYSETDYFNLETDRQKVVICSTYHNEKNLPSGYIEGLIKDYIGNPHLVDMLVYGSPIAKTGGEFYHQFDRMKHIKKIVYDSNYAIHVTFDFNVKPYITAEVAQIIWDDDREKYIVNFIKEYTLSAPRNNSEDLSNAILLDYQKHKSGCYIYGDASGKNRQTVSKEFKHNYSVIESILKPILHDDYDRVLRRNPSLVKRRDFANKILASGYDIELNIDESCKHLITDFEFVKEAPDGGKLKEKAKDSTTGETYEKLGHASDSADYLVCAAFENYFNP